MEIESHKHEQLIRMKEMQNIYALGKTCAYERVKSGLLPQPISLGGRSVGYPLSEVNTVLKAMIRGDSEEQIKALVIELTEQRKELV